MGGRADETERGREGERRERGREGERERGREEERKKGREEEREKERGREGGRREIIIIIIIQFICIAPESIVLLSGALHKYTNNS